MPRMKDDAPAAGEIAPRKRMAMGEAESGAADVASGWPSTTTQRPANGRELSDSERSGKL